FLLPEPRLPGDRVRGRPALAARPALVLHRQPLPPARALRRSGAVRPLHRRGRRGREGADGRPRTGDERRRDPGPPRRTGDGARDRHPERGRRRGIPDLEMASGRKGGRAMSKEVAILGVGMHPWGKWGRNFVEYGIHAANAALDDAGLDWRDVQLITGGET